MLTYEVVGIAPQGVDYHQSKQEWGRVLTIEDVIAAM